jgi:Zn-dependent peptidase ImmA (M78 family)
VAKSADAIINPELLVWARTSAGMGLEEAANALRISSEKLQSWERGQTRPTVKQLHRAAHVYRQSFAAFYLPEPPEVFRPPVKDYRRFPDDSQLEVSSKLLFDLRSAMDRRAMCLELYADRNESPRLFEARTTLRRNPENVGDEIRSLIGIHLDQQRQWRDPRLAFHAWRNGIEALGVLVFQASELDLTEMRGYSISEFPLPIIVVNRKDSPAGRTFTMFHELGHLMLRASGLCDLDALPDRPPHVQKAEVFCNHVAGAALVPKDHLLTDSIVRQHQGPTWEMNQLVSLSRTFGVSREVILRRLLLVGRTNESFYQATRNRLVKEYERRAPGKGFLTVPQKIVDGVGKPFVRLVLDAYYADRITASDVSEYLGAKLRHLDEIAGQVGSG